MYDLVSGIMAYETGEADDQAILELFSHLIGTGMAWSLQGSYGRTAQALIDAGLIAPNGDIAEDWLAINASHEDEL